MYEFGHGLSYTTFDYKWVYSGVVTASTSASSDIIVTASVNVSNIGSEYSSSESVLVFVSPPKVVQQNSTLGAPRKILRNFEKIRLDPGSHKVLEFSLTAADFSLADASGSWSLIPGEWRLTIGELSRNVLIH